MNFALAASTSLLLLVFAVNALKTEPSEDVVFFRPLLMIKKDNETSTLNEHTKIWMDIRKGTYPKISSDLGQRTKVGEPITILIYLSDQKNQDIVVDECWAYNEENYNESTITLQLTNKDSDFQKLFLTNQLHEETQNITVLLHKNLTSFKFSGREYVYIVCNVKLCYRSCSENFKRGRYFSTLNNISPRKGNQPQAASANNTKFPNSKFKPPPLSPTKSTPDSDCTPKSINLLCFLKPQSQCSHGSTNENCLNNKPSTNCTDSQDPKCHNKPITNCYPGSTDPQCNVNYPSICYPGSTDEQCQSLPTDCYLGSENPQCNSSSCYPGSEDPQCSVPNCYPGSQHPLCNSSSVPDCYPGLQNLQCNFSSPAICYPGSQNPQCILNPPLNCFLGSQDPQCSSNIPQCYPGSQNPLCKLVKSWNPRHNNKIHKNCFPGSKNPQCGSNLPETHSNVFLNNGSTLNKNKPNQSIPCFFNMSNPNCQHRIHKNCFPGSKNPQCGSKFSETQSNVFLNNGSILNKNKPNQSIPCFFNMSNPNCQHKIHKNCFPGSKNPQCGSNLSETQSNVFHNNGSIVYKNKPNQSIPCFFNISNPNCQHIRKKRSKRASITVKPTNIINIRPTSSPDCSSYTIDPRYASNINTHIKSTTESSMPVKCISGILSRKSVEETSAQKKLSYNPFLPPNCYPNSKDPRCKQSVTDGSNGTTPTPPTYNPLKPPNCYPGSKDPRCSKF